MTHPTLSVWIVDDDAAFSWILELAVRRHGATAGSFRSTELAVEAFRTGKPDVLITDIRMPGQSGLGLLRKLRVIAPTLPVLVMTADPDLGSAVDAYESGACAYLAKPFDIDAAMRLILRAASPAFHASHSDDRFNVSAGRSSEHRYWCREDKLSRTAYEID
jgi:two-component system, NtrC family, nitrogen regulation response regulator GlnG